MYSVRFEVSLQGLLVRAVMRSSPRDPYDRECLLTEDPDESFHRDLNVSLQGFKPCT